MSTAEGTRPVGIVNSTSAQRDNPSKVHPPRSLRVLSMSLAVNTRFGNVVMRLKGVLGAD